MLEKNTSVSYFVVLVVPFLCFQENRYLSVQIRRTFDTSICTELMGFDFLMGYAVACLSSHARVQEFLLGKLQVCKVLVGGGGVQHFPVGPLAIIYGNLYNL